MKIITPKISTLQEIFVDQLKDLYNAENQIAKALPKMAKAATDPELKRGFEIHLEQTQDQISRLETICEEQKEKPTGKKCKAMEGLIAEGQETMEEDALPEMKDVMLIAAAQRVEHYEIAAYTSLCSLAKILGHTSALQALASTLSEEVGTEAALAKASVPALAKAYNRQEDQN